LTSAGERVTAHVHMMRTLKARDGCFAGRQKRSEVSNAIIYEEETDI
jgi:hypothetical protein